MKKMYLISLMMALVQILSHLLTGVYARCDGNGYSKEPMWECPCDCKVSSDLPYNCQNSIWEEFWAEGNCRARDAGYICNSGCNLMAPCCNHMTGLQKTIDFTEKPKKDCLGNDLPGRKMKGLSFEECKEKCLQLNACLSFVYNRNPNNKGYNCFPKKTICQDSTLRTNKWTDYHKLNGDEGATSPPKQTSCIPDKKLMSFLKVHHNWKCADDGYLIIQQRKHPFNETFSRNWYSYEQGFGNAEEFWTGLRWIKDFVGGNKFLIKFELTHQQGNNVAKKLFTEFTSTMGLGLEKYRLKHTKPFKTNMEDGVGDIFECYHKEVSRPDKLEFRTPEMVMKGFSDQILQQLLPSKLQSCINSTALRGCHSLAHCSIGGWWHPMTSSSHHGMRPFTVVNLNAGRQCFFGLITCKSRNVLRIKDQLTINVHNMDITETRISLKVLPTKVDVDCFSGHGFKYVGKVSRTKTGVSCVRWGDMTGKKAKKYKESNFYENDFDLSKNYCRSPNALDTGKPDDVDNEPWCYIQTAHPFKWRRCDIEKCPEEVDVTCFSGHGFNYVGDVSKTKSGKSCVRWGDMTGEKAKKYKESNFYENDFDISQNYCRNPNANDTGKPDEVDTEPWCYTQTAYPFKWGRCDIERCSEVNCYSGIGTKYVGKVSKAKTGESCVNWRDITGKKSQKFQQRNFYENDFRLSKNYCRNPNAFDTGKPDPVDTAPWCYVDAENPWHWEFCDIKKCP